LHHFEFPRYRNCFPLPVLAKILKEWEAKQDRNPVLKTKPAIPGEPDHFSINYETYSPLHNVSNRLFGDDKLLPRWVYRGTTEPGSVLNFDIADRVVLEVFGANMWQLPELRDLYYSIELVETSEGILTPYKVFVGVKNCPICGDEFLLEKRFVSQQKTCGSNRCSRTFAEDNRKRKRVLVSEAA
jgi:hypothetical protein